MQRLLPNPGAPEASAMIDSVLDEYQWPSNPKNAARAGYMAAVRLLADTQPEKADQDDRETLRDMLDDARAELAAIREALGVAYEPHQSLQDRTLLAAKGVAEQVGPVAPEWEGAEEWQPLAWALCAEENGEDACTELVWEGGPIPEPWGDRWLKYEGEAKRLIALVRKAASASSASGSRRLAPTMSTSTLPAASAPRLSRRAPSRSP